MSEKEFIKVKTLDGRGYETECIINKKEIMYVTVNDIENSEIGASLIRMKNGENIYIFDDDLQRVCKELLENKKENLKEQAEIKLNKFSIEIAEMYIDPSRQWNKDQGIGQRMTTLREVMAGHEEAIGEKIKLMSYQDFLKTPYWKAISSFMKIKRGKCEICGNRYNLHTHHKSYKYHGYELDFLEDLEVICETCHSKLHKEYQPIYQNNTTVNTKQEEK